MADQEGLAAQAKRNGGESGDENGALRDRLASLNGIARAGGGAVRAGQSAAGGFAGASIAGLGCALMEPPWD